MVEKFEAGQWYFYKSEAFGESLDYITSISTNRIEMVSLHLLRLNNGLYKDGANITTRSDRFRPYSNKLLTILYGLNNE